MVKAKGIKLQIRLRSRLESRLVARLESRLTTRLGSRKAWKQVGEKMVRRWVGDFDMVAYDMVR